MKEKPGNKSTMPFESLGDDEGNIEDMVTIFLSRNEMRELEIQVAINVWRTTGNKHSGQSLSI